MIVFSNVQEMNEIEEREKADRKKKGLSKDKKRKADEEIDAGKKKAKAQTDLSKIRTKA